MASASPNKVFTDAAERYAKRVVKDRKRKNTEAAKETRRRSKFAQGDNTAAARSAYSRHDNGLTPEEVDDDVPPEHLEQMKIDFYKTKVVVTKDEAMEIETCTRDQSDSMQWLVERRKRLTASKVGSIAKMKTTRKYKNYSTTDLEETRPHVMVQQRKKRLYNST